ncbi:MAG: hypothetical protein RL414_403 [Actinomycetota bacterium]
MKKISTALSAALIIGLVGFIAPVAAEASAKPTASVKVLKKVAAKKVVKRISVKALKVSLAAASLETTTVTPVETTTVTPAPAPTPAATQPAVDANVLLIKQMMDLIKSLVEAKSVPANSNVNTVNPIINVSPVIQTITAPVITSTAVAAAIVAPSTHLTISAPAVPQVSVQVPQVKIGEKHESENDDKKKHNG